MDILQMVKDAQCKLRATQINWQEECLFDCDDILTGVIRELENAQQSVHPTGGTCAACGEGNVVFDGCCINCGTPATSG